jgi:hypothetical protein
VTVATRLFDIRRISFGATSGDAVTHMSVTFDSYALAAGSNTGVWELRFNDTGWGSFTESGDHSSINGASSVEHMNFAAGDAGSLVWGYAP